MSAAELDIEPRSEDESDAGSLVDFVCSDDEEIEVQGDHTDTPVRLLQSAVIRGGARRSTRRCAAPVRYMDPDYVSMMTDDVDIERVLSDTELEEADQAAESSEDQEYTASSESASSSEYSEEDSGEDSDDSEFYVSDETVAHE